jgi:hypothetical protein
MGLFGMSRPDPRHQAADAYKLARTEVWDTEIGRIGKQEFQRRRSAVTDAQLGNPAASHDFDEWDRLLAEAVAHRAEELLRAMQKN